MRAAFSSSASSRTSSDEVDGDDEEVGRPFITPMITQQNDAQKQQTNGSGSMTTLPAAQPLPRVSSILLPSTLFPISSSDDISPEDIIGAGRQTSSSALLFASQVDSNPSSAVQSPNVTLSPVKKGWLEQIMQYMVTTNEGEEQQQQQNQTQIQMGELRDNNANPPPSSHPHRQMVQHPPPSNPSSPDVTPTLVHVTPVLSPNAMLQQPPVASSPPPSRLQTFSNWSLLFLIVFFVLFLMVYAFEQHRESEIRKQRMETTAELALASFTVVPSAALSTPSSLATMPHHDTLNPQIDAREQLVQKSKELNQHLIRSHEQETRIHTLERELTRRSESLEHYKLLLQRINEHTLREAAFNDISRDADLAKYRSKLLYLIFGNSTLEESRKEFANQAALAAGGHETDALIRQLVVEESQHKQSVSDLLHRGANTELKVESVMRIQELQEHAILGEDDPVPANSQNPSDPHSLAASGSGSSPSSPSSKSNQAPADKLIDSAKNEYILSKPGDSSKKTIDTRLVLDLGIVIIASAISGLVANMLRQPILLGYIIGGSLIYYAGLIGQFIQIETLAQFGSTFLLFALGVEFNIGKLKKVQSIALLGGLIQLLSMILFVSFLCVSLLDVRGGLKTGIFIGCVLSMSSTTIVIKSLMENRQIQTLCGQVMLGLLIIQDCFLSLILALLTLMRVPLERFTEELFWLGMKFCFLGLIVLVCMYIWPILLRLLDSSKSHDLFLMGLVGLCVFLTVVSEKIINSPEVGAFLSGILISSSPNADAELTHRSLRLFSPIRDMFGALFFSSIGMLINPMFLWEKLGIILVMVVATVVLKSLLTFLIVRLFGYSLEIALRTGLGLSQIGEFAFVLASEGVSSGLLTKETYFLLLGTTAVSIFVTPFILSASLVLVKYFQLEDKKAHGLGVQVD